MFWKKGRKKGGNCFHKRHGKKHKHFRNHPPLTLNKAKEHKEYKVIHNSDRKTVEMGILKGNIITVLKNDKVDSNIIVAVGESRYGISREIAKTILVK